ncbi:hypothetical protein KC316_g1862 [Hortaea werneckii]|nr:hypothetical protein KC324_g3377 [Hortaea werneckii]KAI7593221.1 hypothetical protein KC316_g1862 [Hortaea werneckii]
MSGTRAYKPPDGDSTEQIKKDLRVSSLHWLIEEVARQCPEFASYQLLKKQDWVKRGAYKMSGGFEDRMSRIEGGHMKLDITIDRHNTPYADMDAVDICVRAMKCVERILSTSRNGLSRIAKKREHKDYPTWPVGLNRHQDRRTEWELVHNIVDMCSHHFSSGKVLDIKKKPNPGRQATAMQANVQRFEQAVGWRAQDTLLTAYGQAQLQARMQNPQQVQQPLQQQIQQPLQQQSEAPDANGSYPHLAVEIRLVDIMNDEPAGSETPFVSTTWSECHDFQAMEAVIHDIYDSDNTQSKIMFVHVPHYKDAWHELDPIGDERFLQVMARVSILEHRSLQLVVHHTPPKY